MVYEIMKKPALVLLLAAVLMSQGCSRMKEIRVISCRPESVSVQGLRGIHAEASVEVDNPARTIYMSDIEGTVYAGEDVIGHFTAGDVTLEGRTSSACPVSLDFTLDRSVSIIGLLSIVRSLDADDIVLDLSLKARTKGGVSKKDRLKRLPVSHLVGNAGFAGNLEDIRDILL